MFSKVRISLLRMTAIVMAAALCMSPIAAAEGSTTAIETAAQSDKLSVSEEYRIVVIGDSIAAGYELGFTEESVPYGYAEHVYEQALFQGYRAEYVNYGILGLRTNGLKLWLNAAEQGLAVTEADIQPGLLDPRAERIFAQTKQLKADLRAADLILVSIGGNDFSPLLKGIDPDAFERLSNEAQTEQLTKLQPVLEELLDSYESELEAALHTVLKLKPDAQIVIADQYLPIPAPLKTKDGVRHLFPEKAAAFLADSAEQLRDRLDILVTNLVKDGYNLKVAEAGQAIAGYELFYTSIQDGDIHPTRTGYAALGKAFTKEIWGDYRTVKPRAKDVPISVVVNGEELLTPYTPVIIKGRTFLAVRDIAEAMGAEMDWDAATRTATYKLDDRVVDITVGAATIRINGETVPLQAEPAYLHKINNESKTYVPLAALSEGLGFQVVYREGLKIAFINR